MNKCVIVRLSVGSDVFLHNFLALKHRYRKQKHVIATHQRRTQRFSLTWIWFCMILWYLGPIIQSQSLRIQKTFLLSLWLSPEVFLTLNSRGKPCDHLYSDQLKNTSTTKHTSENENKHLLSPGLDQSSGWSAQCFFMLCWFFFFFRHVWTRKVQWKPLPTLITAAQHKTFSLTHTQVRWAKKNRPDFSWLDLQVQLQSLWCHKSTPLSKVPKSTLRKRSHIQNHSIFLFSF